MLVVDCCIRGEESATRKYYRAYLEKAGIPAEEITVLDLSREEVASCLYTQIPESRINIELFNHHQKTEYPYNHTENAF